MASFASFSQEYQDWHGEEDSNSETRPPVYASPFFNLEGTLTIPYLKICNQCQRPGKNLCSACKSVFYCSKKCQSKDWKHGHNLFCKRIQSSLSTLHKEERNLQHYCDYSSINSTTMMNYFAPENGIIGLFGSYEETKPYCHALVDTIQMYSCNTSKQGIYEAILIVMKSLYVNRIDNMSLKDLVPALFIRIDYDQLAYDFIRWYILYPDTNYNWYNPRLPFLHYWKCDRSEELPVNRFTSLSHVVMYGLIKVRLYLYLVNVDAMYTFLTLLHGNHARECYSPLAKLEGQVGVHHLIKDYLVGVSGRGFGNDFKIVRDKHTILNQFHKIFQKGQELNPRIWKAIVDSAPLLSQPPPTSCSKNTAEECYFPARNCLPAWIAHNDCMYFLIRYVKNHGGMKYDYVMREFGRGY